MELLQKINFNIKSYDTELKFSLLDIRNLISMSEHIIKDMGENRDKYSYSSMNHQDKFKYDYQIEQYQETLIKLNAAKSEIEAHLNKRCKMKFNKRCKNCDTSIERSLRTAGIFTS